MQAKYKVERIFLKKFCKLQEGYLAQLNYYFLEQVSKLQAQSNIFKEIFQVTKGLSYATKLSFLG